MARAGSVKIQLSVESASYSQALDKAKQSVDQLAGGATRAGHSTVSSMQASSAALRELNGDFTNNIRAVERFITTVPGVGQALQAAFPVVGALALAGVIGNLGSKVYDFYKKLGETPRAIQTGFDGLLLTTQTATDELIKKTDETNDHINVLLGKRPENQAKIAIDNTRIAADQLAASASAAAKQIAELMAANKISTFSAIFSKQGGTDDAAGTANYWLKDLQDRTFKAQQAYHSGNNSLGDQLTAQYKQRRDEAITSLSANAQNREDHRDQFAGNQGPSISMLRGTASIFMAESDQETARANDKNATEREKGIEQQKALAAREREAEQRAAQERMRGLQDQLSDMPAADAGDKFLFWQKQTDTFKKGSEQYFAVVKNAGEAYREVMKENQESLKKAAIPGGIDPQVMGFFGPVSPNSAGMHLAIPEAIGEEDSKRYLGTDAKASQDSVKALNERLAAQRQQPFAMREVQTQSDAAQGTLSRYDAVLQSSVLHADQYAEAMGRLKDALASINAAGFLSPNEQSAQRNAALGQMSDMTGARAIQQIQDSAALDSTTLSGSFRETLNSFVQDSKDSASQIKQIMTESLSSVNGTLSTTLLEHSRTSREYWRNVRNGLSGSARGIGSSILNTGFQKAEGATLGALGFGGKADGSQNSPFWVKVVDAITGGANNSASSLQTSPGRLGNAVRAVLGTKTLGLGGSDPLGLTSSADAPPGAVDTSSYLGTGTPDLGGSILSGIGGAAKAFGPAFQGFFASGGDVVSDRPAIIGEKGPEMFIPKQAGTIIPNSQLDMGDTHHHWNVDARGASDPAAVNAAVMRGIKEAAPQIIAASNYARTERNRRLPRSQRV